MENNELKHHGVKGMKWGVRRSQAKLDRIAKKAAKKGWSDDAKSAAEIKTKRLYQMSNTELKKLNERTRLEKEYKNLNEQKKMAGEKFVSNLLKESSKELAKEYTKKAMRRGMTYVSEIME